MIELRGLHLGNVARSPEESVRPDLWPDHAWVPALGCTGGRLYDLCGWWNAAAATPAWAPDGYDATTVGAIALLPTKAEVDGPWTAFSLQRMVSIGSSVIFCKGGLTTSSLYFTTSSSVRAYIGGQYLEARGIDALSIGQCVSVAWRNDGEALSFAINERWYTHPTTATSRAFIIDRIGGVSSYPTDAIIGAHAFFRRALTDAQVLDLTADPLLPFRRRQPVFYSVPSGGGSIETPAAMMMAL